MNEERLLMDSRFARWQRLALGAGALSMVISVVGGLLISPAQFYRVYLASYLFFLGIALGGMAILMLYHVTGGAWGYLVRRLLEAEMSTLPLLAVMFLPIAFGLPDLYRWAQPELVAASESLQSRQFYFQPTYFWIRAAVYFAVWLLLVWLLRKKSRQQDRSDDPGLAPRAERLSEFGLLAFGTSMHFAAFDWVQSLESGFHSTIFPLLVTAGMLLSAHAFVLVALAYLPETSSVSELASPRARIDLGNLMLTFLIIWAYLGWFQFMLIWIANLHYGARWFLPRMQGGWGWLLVAIVIGHFVVPLFLLLMRFVKSNAKRAGQVAGLVLLMQFFFMYWQVMPVFSAPRLADHWVDVIMPIGIGGLWLGVFLMRLRAQPLLVAFDPNRKSAESLLELEREDIEREEALAHG